MIYQIKVTLVGSKPPIWRRMQVHADITFYQLHEILQIAFEWHDLHLHEFTLHDIPADKRASVRKPALIPTFSQHIQEILSQTQGVRIGQVSDEEDWGPPPLDEHQEVLSDWLREENSRMFYTYDFGDDWRHTIVLEKILEESPDTEYPICMKARREAPSYVSDEEPEDSIPDTEIMRLINDQLRASGDKFIPASHANKAPPADHRVQTSASVDHQASSRESKDVLESLFLQAKEFARLQPWTWMSDTDIFAVYDAISEETLYCCVLGEAGELFGLVVYRGNQGLHNLADIFNEQLQSGVEAEELQFQQHAFVLSFEDRADLEQDEYNQIRASGVSFRGRKAWPVFHDRTPGYMTTLLGHEEATLMCRVLQQAIEVCSRNLHEPNVLLVRQPNHFFARISEQQDGQLFWRDGSVPALPVAIEEPEVLAVSELELASVRKNMRQAPGLTLEYDMFYLPYPVDDDDRAYFPMMGFSLEISQGMMLMPGMAHPDVIHEALQTNLLDNFKSLQALPETIYVQRERAGRVIRPLCDKLGIELTLVQELPLINQMRPEMVEMMDKM